jgi:hypothetical protein
MPPQFLCDIRSRASASERIADQISGVGREQNDPFEDNRGELVGWAVLISLVSHGRNVIPHVTEIQALGVEKLLVPTVILHIPSAMSAHLNRNSYVISIEDTRPVTLDKVQHPVVAS